MFHLYKLLKNGKIKEVPQQEYEKDKCNQFIIYNAMGAWVFVDHAEGRYEDGGPKKCIILTLKNLTQQKNEVKNGRTKNIRNIK